MKKFLLAILLVTSLGCTTPASAPQGVYQAKSDFAAGLIIATQYKALPVCEDKGPVICKKEAVVKTVLQVAEGAKIALDNAETVVRTDGIGKDIAATAEVSAIAAVKTLTAITSKLKVN